MKQKHSKYLISCLFSFLNELSEMPNIISPPHPLNLQIYSIYFLLFYFLYINKKVGVLCEMYIKT